MCGRYASARSVDDLASTFGIADADIDELPPPDWNIAPTKPVTAVLVRGDRRSLTTLRWGLVPAWATSMDMTALFNARIETVAEKPAFREAIRRQRCVFPADGWYEWARLPDGRRIPHYLTSRDGDVVALAGVWDTWRDADGRPLRSGAVLTGAAHGELASVHDRAPLVLARQHWDAWLQPETPAEVVASMLVPTDPDLVRIWPVGDAVGDVRANGPKLTEPVQLDEQPPLF